MSVAVAEKMRTSVTFEKRVLDQLRNYEAVTGASPQATIRMAVEAFLIKRQVADAHGLTPADRDTIRNASRPENIHWHIRQKVVIATGNDTETDRQVDLIGKADGSQITLETAQIKGSDARYALAVALSEEELLHTNKTLSEAQQKLDAARRR